jgi:hypothetical protein
MFDDRARRRLEGASFCRQGPRFGCNHHSSHRPHCTSWPARKLFPGVRNWLSSRLSQRNSA